MTLPIARFDSFSLVSLFSVVALCAGQPSALGVAPEDSPAALDAYTVDFRYAPATWQTSICLPDDWQKTLVSQDGALLYDYPGKIKGFGLRMTSGLTEGTVWLHQDLASPRVPIVQTQLRSGEVEILQEALALPPMGALAASQSSDSSVAHPTRYDLLTIRLCNAGRKTASVTPTFTIESAQEISLQPDRIHVQIGASTTVHCPAPCERVEQSTGKAILVFTKQEIPPGGERHLAFAVARGPDVADSRLDLAGAAAMRKEAERYWQTVNLPYNHLQVPDPGIQALLDSSVRNIYQAREIKKGLPAFQVGPTCYRGLWVVDGSFLLEAITYLGRTNETRSGIEYLLSFQREDGGVMLIDGHWKETGIALWAITRHAQLTGDKTWLREVWPRVEHAFAYIGVMRQLASKDPHAPNSGLIPEGFSDGGLADQLPEYTNVYWTLAGMRAAVESARWLGKTAEADDWQRQFQDFYDTFRRAAQRDTRSGPSSLSYLPIRMAKGEGIPPQKAQWAFLHAVFPGRVFSPGDPLVRGNMAMLQAVEREGLVFDTGWLKDGLWNYFGSFYAHAWLWLGDGAKAARTLYAFGNHASPLLVWREEQKPVGQGDQIVGDMPHNWASAEFIRLVRHALVLERGNELHLFEALPARWARAGSVTRVQDVLTDFGPISLELRVAPDGRSADLQLKPPTRTPPTRLVLHLDNWSGQTGTIDLPGGALVQKTIPMKSPDSGKL